MATRLRIRGLVQGVGYRASFARQARQLELSGWVRNRRDGSVEALLDGSETALGEMLAWAHKGPPSARVSQVQATPDAEDAGSGFRIAADA